MPCSRRRVQLHPRGDARVGERQPRGVVDEPGSRHSHAPVRRSHAARQVSRNACSRSPASTTGVICSRTCQLHERVAKARVSELPRPANGSVDRCPSCVSSVACATWPARCFRCRVTSSWLACERPHRRPLTTCQLRVTAVDSTARRRSRLGWRRWSSVAPAASPATSMPTEPPPPDVDGLLTSPDGHEVDLLLHWRGRQRVGRLLGTADAGEVSRHGFPADRRERRRTLGRA
jgi:hypothetical protein